MGEHQIADLIFAFVVGGIATTVVSVGIAVLAVKVFFKKT